MATTVTSMGEPRSKGLLSSLSPVDSSRFIGRTALLGDGTLILDGGVAPPVPRFESALSADPRELDGLAQHGWWRSLAWNVRVTAPIVVADIATIAALLLGSVVAASFFLGASIATVAEIEIIVSTMIALVVIRSLEGLYPGVGLNIVTELRKQTLTTTAVFAVMTLSWSATGRMNAVLIVTQLISYFACLLVLPQSRRVVQGLLGRTRWWGYPVLIFGTGPVAQRILTAMRRSASRGLRPVGCVGPAADIFGGNESVPFDDYLGGFDEATEVIERHGVQWLIAAMPEKSQSEVAYLISTYAQGVPHRLLATGIVEFSYLCQVVRDCGGQSGIEVRDGLLSPSRQAFKRVFDLLAVLTGGLLISPLLIAIAVAIKLSSPGPVFYGQRRIGFGGTELTIWKFRSMVCNADAVLQHYLDAHPEMREEWERTHKLQNDPRITTIGHILRKTSLDELPQLWNIVMGEMSLVGPRPIVDDVNYDREYLEKYPEAYSLYLKVRPGITGLWQVAGRLHRDYYLRPSLDAFYVRNWSIWLDVVLLVRTVKTVLLREGAC